MNPDTPRALTAVWDMGPEVDRDTELPAGSGVARQRRAEARSAALARVGPAALLEGLRAQERVAGRERGLVEELAHLGRVRSWAHTGTASMFIRVSLLKPCSKTISLIQNRFANQYAFGCSGNNRERVAVILYPCLCVCPVN